MKKTRGNLSGKGMKKELHLLIEGLFVFNDINFNTEKNY